MAVINIALKIFILKYVLVVWIMCSGAEYTRIKMFASIENSVKNIYSLVRSILNGLDLH